MSDDTSEQRGLDLLEVIDREPIWHARRGGGSLGRDEELLKTCWCCSCRRHRDRILLSWQKLTQSGATVVESASKRASEKGLESTRLTQRYG